MQQERDKQPDPVDPASNDGDRQSRGDSAGAVSDAERACRAALAVHHVAGPIEASLDAQGMADLYHSIENPLVRVLAKMEHVGVGVDCDTGSVGTAVVIDPPRKGSTPEFLDQLIAFAPARVVYVSCNPTTLARDLEELARQARGSAYIVDDLESKTTLIEIVRQESKYQSM